jgi:hypothetical protein
MKTVSKLLLIASIGLLVFFTTHLIFFDKEVKNLITLNGVDHILHHIVLLKFLVGAIFTALCGVLIFEFLPSKVIRLTKHDESPSNKEEVECSLCKMSGIKYPCGTCLGIPHPDAHLGKPIKHGRW